MQKSRDETAVWRRCDVTPLNETAPHGQREVCTLSSVQNLVHSVILGLSLSLGETPMFHTQQSLRRISRRLPNMWERDVLQARCPYWRPTNVPKAQAVHNHFFRSVIVTSHPRISKKPQKGPLGSPIFPALPSPNFMFIFS